MKNTPKAPLSTVLHWQLALVKMRIGNLSLAVCVLPLALLVTWLGFIAPQTAHQRAELTEIQQQLRPVLPLDQQQPDLQQQLSMDSWQQVRMIFDQLKQHKLRVEASRYQIDQQGDAQILRLDIPLKGDYLPLMQTLESLSRSLPLDITHLSLQRLNPTAGTLNVTLQLQLKKEQP